MENSLKEDETEEDEEMLKSILEEDEEKADNNVAENPTKENSLNKEAFEDASAPFGMSMKRKRSHSTPTLRRQSDQADDAADVKEYIKSYLALENDENNNLAKALNLATLSQVSGNNKLILEEADYIKNAIEDERSIQDMKNELKSANYNEKAEKRSDKEFEVIEEEEKYEPEENAVQEEDSDDIDIFNDYVTAKLRQYLMRSQQKQSSLPESYEQSLGRWLSQPVTTNDEGARDEEELTLNPFLRELWERYQREGARGSFSKRGPIFDLDSVVDGGYPEEEQVAEQEEMEANNPDDEAEEEIKTVLQTYMAEMTPEQRMMLKESIKDKVKQLDDAEEEEAEEEEAEEEEEADEMNEASEYCPALDELDDCEAARKAGLHLDMEALYMCNRHQMCYTCGSSHGFTAKQCDKGYYAEAVLLCSREANPDGCERDAMLLLQDMTEKHQWLPFYRAPPTCSETCAADYILGTDDKK